MFDVPLDDDPWSRRWARRALTIPAVHLGALLAWGLLPLWLLLAALLDLLGRRPRWPTTRAALVGAVYLLCECLGVQAALLTWLCCGFGRLRGPLLRADLWLQRTWAGALFAAMEHICDVRVQVEGADALPPGGRFLLFLRHASLPDVLLPAVGFANPRRIALRYVLKVEVCWSPCLDVVGHRLPNAFVRRGSGDPAREVARVLRLHRDLGPGEGLVIYPEGTRFSARKRQALLDRLDGEERIRAASFHNVLPPRPGGPLALLQARGEDEDVVFCAHVGTEGANRAAALLDGALIGRTFRVAVWRVPAAEVPREAEAARAWLDAWWHRVDAWVGDGLGGAPGQANGEET